MTWNWNQDGTLAGTFVMLVTMRLDVSGNRFEGRWVADSFDLAGEPVGGAHAEGPVRGTRVTVD